MKKSEWKPDEFLKSLTSHVRETEGPGKALDFFIDYIQPIKKYFEYNKVHKFRRF